ncbi:hypothetical protein HMPREF9194_02132 [Treponema maltophilum ATCC 51939]|uniref:N-acetyltransferase domain-containing protein n=1 Tax=Treponema maltophilum ATCC 51939 TaxID=1125699 RepID=S3L4P1_TREMA|nr:GNAT family N-acetyltransferase [Treponema maltophilum]EPF31779.1 hypothetical protein HMPREF9194_02132 [Treponema maltophilum ATCC 51939]
MKPFSLAPITENDLNDVQEFLLPRERFCAALVSLFANRPAAEAQARFLLPASGACGILRHRTEIIGVLYISPSGLVYHCLPLSAFSPDEREQIAALCAAFPKGSAVSSIVGCFEASRFLERCFKLCPKEARFYKLMCADTQAENEGSRTERDVHRSEPSPRSFPNGLSVRRCRSEHAPFLFPLVKAYYEEEVLPSWMKVDDETLKLLTAGRLRTQFMFGLELPDGSFAATAGTNNIGIHCAQLGGVYTLPSFRRRGCASFLLRRVCEELRSHGYSPVLFVRSENKAALALYEGCGFSGCGDYAISYY